MKKLWLLLLLPTLAHADRLGALHSDADVLLTTQAVSGGGGSSSLEVMANGLRVSSPTASINLIAGTNVTLSGALTGGATAAITINATAGSTVLQSSGIAFGSPANAVTSDTNTFIWDNTKKDMTIHSQTANPAGLLIDDSQASDGVGQGIGVEGSMTHFQTGYGTYGSVAQPSTTNTGFATNLYGAYGTASGGLFSTTGAPSVYGTYGTASCTRSWGTIYGAYGVSAGCSNSPAYGGYLSATGGSQSFGLFVAAGQAQINSSMTVTGAGGIVDTYGLSVGSMTGAGLSSCSGASNAVTWNSGTNLFGCNTITASGGGASTLAVTTGTVSGFGVPTTSPTFAVVFDSRTTYGNLTGGGTYFFSLRPDSVTLQGVITAASLGALTANQSITLSGDSTGSGTTAITVTAAALQPNITTLNAASGIAVVASTFNVNNVKMIWPSSGTVGNYLRYVSSNTLGWDGVPAGAAGTTTNGVVGSSITVQLKCAATDKLEPNFAINTSTGSASSNYVTCSFDNVTQQYVNGFFKLPSNLDPNGTVTIRTYGRSSTAASSKNVGWIFEYIPLSNGTAYSTAYKTSISGALALSATQGNNDSLSWTVSTASLTWTSDQAILFRFSRDVAVANNLASPYYDSIISFDIPILSTGTATGLGIVNSGTIYQTAYYGATGTTVSGTSNIQVNPSSVTVTQPLHFQGGRYDDLPNTVNGNYTAVSTDTVILASSTLSVNGGITITLPSASTDKGQTIEIYKVDQTTNPVKVVGAGTDTISSTGTWTLNAYHQAIQIKAMGAVNGAGDWECVGFGCQQTPAFVPEFMSGRGATTGAVYTANHARCYLFTLNSPAAFQSANYVVNTQSGNCDFGVYSIAGGTAFLAASKGSFTCPTAAAKNATNFTSVYQAPPGQYMACTAADNTSVRFTGISAQNFTAAYDFPSAFPLPATLTMSNGAVTPSVDNVMIGIVGGQSL